MVNNNYNKYFKTKEENQDTKEVKGKTNEVKVDTKEIKEKTNDKNIRGTSLKIPLKFESKIETERTHISDKSVDNTSTIEPLRKQKGGVISPHKVNMREEATKNSKVLCILDPGTNVVVESVDGDWVHIYIPQGIDGYVMKEYIIISQL
jgi:hypothetical protein